MNPPDTLSEDLAPIWREVVADHPHPERIVGHRLEAYCALIAQLRRAHDDITEHGLTLTEPTGKVVPNPALAVAASAQEAIRRWGREFARPVRVARRSGPMYDATTQSITAAPHLQDRKFGAAIAAVKTLAWLIDEAQREGMESLQRAAFGTIPTYLKACGELQITPSKVPLAPAKPADEKKSKLGKLQILQGGAG